MAGENILLVDDEPNMLLLLQEWLEPEGYQVHTAADGREGLQAFSHHRPALSVVDLIMPRMGGLDLISRIREMSDAHILVLTAVDSEELLIRGLSLGADGHLLKPVSRRVFLARVQALLRRAAPPPEPTAAYSDAHVTLNFLTHEAQVRQRPLKLRPTEFRLLGFLCKNRHRVVGHQELLDNVWGDQAGSLDSLKWYIYSLREKVEENPRSPRLIVTVPGVGYRYDSEERPPPSHGGQPGA